MTTQFVPRAPPAEERVPHQEAMVLGRFGGPDGFSLEHPPMPTAGAGEVRVRVLAACVQFTDVLIREGKYPDNREQPPLVLGYDVIGEIDSLGPAGTGTLGYGLGDRVAALTVTGSYARYRTLRAADVVLVPRELDPAEAATMVLSWTTAEQLLHRIARVQRGQRVLVQGAAGAVGQALVVLAKLAGLEVWGTVRAPQFDLVRSLGATPLLPSADPLELVGGGFDAVFDGIGEHGFSRSWACVKQGGTLAAFGFSEAIRSGGSPLALGLTLLKLKLWNAFGDKAARFYSITALRKKRPDWYRKDLEKLFDLLSKKAIRPHIAARIGLADVAAAHRRLEAGHLDGKLVICP